MELENLSSGLDGLSGGGLEQSPSPPQLGVAVRRLLGAVTASPGFQKLQRDEL